MSKAIAYFLGILTGVFLALLILGFAFLLLRDRFQIVSLEAKNQPQQQQQPNDQNSNNPQGNTQPVETSTKFTGSSVQATLPTGWKIIEYKDGLGTTMLTTGPKYTGLTGLEVQNDASQGVFKLSAVYGVGGTDQCLKYAKFSDFNQADYNTHNAQNIADFGSAISIDDVTGKTYTSFNLLGLSVRRIDTTLYYDTVASNNTFEPASCGLGVNMPTFQGVSYTADGKSYSNYQWKVVGIPSAADLLKMDGVLNSIKAI